MQHVYFILDIRNKNYGYPKYGISTTLFWISKIIILDIQKRNKC